MPAKKLERNRILFSMLAVMEHVNFLVGRTDEKEAIECRFRKLMCDTFSLPPHRNIICARGAVSLFQITDPI